VPERSGRPPRARPTAGPASRQVGAGAPISAALLILIVGAALGIILAQEDTMPAAGMTASGGAEDAAAQTPAPPPAVPAVPEVAEVASPPSADETAAPGEPREPTPDDVADFVASFAPEGARAIQTVAVDLVDDGRNEVLVASLSGGTARLDVATWDGRAYTVVATDTAGPAESIESFVVRDVTGDDRREILLAQTAPGRDSIALWGVAVEDDGGSVVRRLEARGGCWDGAHVFGHTGATVDDGELIASCDPAGSEDLLAGAEHGYRWDGQAWIHQPPAEDP
jgi:hypothetical protein